KYRVFYMCDATPQEYYRWMDWLLENVELELVSYFSGHGTQIPDKTGREKDGLTEVLVFYDEKRRQQIAGGGVPPKITPLDGITNETISDTVMHDLIVNKEYPQTRVVLISDCCHSGTMFNFDQPVTGLHKQKPPPHVVCIGAAQDAQTAKQTQFKGVDSGVFTYNFNQLIRQKPQTTFLDLQTYMSKNIKKYQTIQITGSDQSLFNGEIIINLEDDDSELQLSNLPPLLDGAPPASITSVAPVDVPSRIEEESAKQRWAQFTSELKKPAPYDSKYRAQLTKLDQMGCINLERIQREQIPPNTQIDNCAALFFCPYEDLPHTLDTGPVNDALSMAELFIARKYNVVYLCDATPHEYYKWMDWLLENVELELCSYFSGHGTQVPDKTGKEADGLSEVMVFYNAKKKSARGGIQKITPVKGITDETVEDTTMHDLIVSKDYPQTRIVLISDCCHSGTLFNFDQPLPVNGKKKAPKTNRISVVCVGSAIDSETAKQTVLGGLESGVFTYNFCNLLKQKPHSSFLDLQQHMTKNIKKYQTIQVTATDQRLFANPVIIDARS
ncbi:MAG: hypothetical protein EZS28_037940, partial [Streblomastix strix]